MFDNRKMKDHIVLISYIHFGDVKTLIILTWKNVMRDIMWDTYRITRMIET